MGLLMGKFCQILTELSAGDTPIFLFPEDNLSKCQGILTKLGTCIDIKEIRFGIVNGQISSIFAMLSACNLIMIGYYRFTFICPRHFQWGHNSIIAVRTYVLSVPFVPYVTQTVSVRYLLKRLVYWIEILYTGI